MQATEKVKNTMNNETKKYTIDAEVSARVSAAKSDIESAYNRTTEKARRVKARGDIGLGVEVKASGFSAFCKYALTLEQTSRRNGSNAWEELRAAIITACGNKCPNAHIVEIPTFGARNDDWSDEKQYTTCLSRSYAVMLADTFASVAFIPYGVILPTVVDYPTAEKFAKTFNRLFNRKEAPHVVFGKAKDDARARISSLEETNARLLAELRELKEELAKK
jgi:hypothetical protein